MMVPVTFGSLTAFKRLEILTSPSKYGRLRLEGRQNVHDVVKARDVAIRALYREVIPIT